MTTEKPMFNSFKERVLRLARFVELKAPKTVIAQEVCMVFGAAFAAFPAEMARAFGYRIGAAESGSCGVCPRCNGYRPHEMHYCDACLRKDDEQAEAEVSAELERDDQ